MSLPRVELDASNCIVIRVPRISGPDHVVTVTNVELLCHDLQTAQTYQRINHDLAAGQRLVGPVPLGRPS